MKNIKAILFDVDGVLIRPPHFYNKELELKGYKGAEESLNTYYSESNHLPSIEGRVDSKESITPYLRNFGWEHSADEYFEQQFGFERKYLDRDVMLIVDKLRTQGVKCYLATDQEKHRAQYLLESMNFKTIFNAHFISCLIGSRKCHNSFWEYVIRELKAAHVSIEPDEIMFFDDIQGNIDTALKFGIKAKLFESVSQFENDRSFLVK